MDKKTAAYLLHRRLYEAYAAWDLDIYAEMLEDKHGWNVESGREKGREALVIFLVQKYRWTVEYCRSLNDADLRLALADELKDWKKPKELDSIEKAFSDAFEQNPASEFPTEPA